MACNDCASGHLHEGTPTGRVETVHGLQTYVTSPPGDEASKGIVVIIPDAFGWNLNNNRILADAYAKRAGVTVYLPDFMNGYVLEHSLLGSMDTMVDSKAGIMSRLFSGLRTVYYFAPYLWANRPGVAMPRILSFLTSLRTSTDDRIGVAGFCWGGKFAVLLCDSATYSTDNGKSLIDFAFVAHPSNLSLPTDIEKVTLPLRICQGSEDFVLNMDGVRQIEGIFAGKEKQLDESQKGRFVITVVEGAKHGFAIRGNLGIEEEVKHGMVAEDDAVEWFQKWVSSNSSE